MGSGEEMYVALSPSWLTAGIYGARRIVESMLRAVHLGKQRCMQ